MPANLPGREGNPWTFVGDPHFWNKELNIDRKPSKTNSWNLKIDTPLEKEKHLQTTNFWVPC